MHPANAHHLCLSRIITSRLQLRLLCPSTTFSQSCSAHARFRAPCLQRDTSAAQACSLHNRRRPLGRSQRRGVSATAGADTAAVAIGQDSCSSSAGEGSLGAYSSNEDSSPVTFEMCKIPGDGSCLFRALAQGQHQLQKGSLLPDKQLLKAGYDLRSNVCKMMIERKDEIAPFITGIFDAYVEAMALEGCWGGEPELAIAIHCLQRPIVVYKEVHSSLFGKHLEKVSVYGAEEYPGVSPVCVLFSGAHYDTLLQVPAAA